MKKKKSNWLEKKCYESLAHKENGNYSDVGLLCIGMLICGHLSGNPIGINDEDRDSISAGQLLDRRALVAV
ncbi:MAG: hypothetical protein PSU89_11255 [Methylobacter sp.]|nr:hypothetical protein [Methylobacter sp.]